MRRVNIFKNIYSTSTTGENVTVVYPKKILKNTKRYLYWSANFNHFCLYASVLQMSVLGRVELKSFFVIKIPIVDVCQLNQ